MNSWMASHDHRNLLRKVPFLLLVLSVLGGVVTPSSAQIDTFDGNVIDLQEWKISVPLGASTVTQNDALFVSSDGTLGGFCFTPLLFGPGAGIALRQKLAGDFDIQVDFSGFTGPDLDFVQVFLNVYQDPTNQMHIKLLRGSSFPDGDILQTVADVAGNRTQPFSSIAPVTSGRFRVVRTGIQIDTYFSGVQNFSVSPGFTGPVIVSLILLDQSGSSSSVQFDNFNILSGTLIEPPLTCPDENQPPVAVCQDVTVWADGDCQGTVTAAMVDNGSSDPDPDDTITLSLDPPGPSALGDTPVTLTVTDNNGASDSCPATVTVIDDRPPSTQIHTFDGNVIDLQTWKISEPLGASTVTQNDTLLVSSDGDGTHGTFCFTPGLFGPGAGIALRRQLACDFDIQVDFSGFAAPYPDYTQVFFNVYQDPDNQLHIKLQRRGNADFLQTVARVAGVSPIESGTIIDPVTSGTFRIFRNGNQISTFLSEVPDFSIPAFSGPVTVSMILLDETGLSASVQFDNFEVLSGTLIDPRLTCPGDNQPPEITCNDPVVLWSPNHELIDVGSAFSVSDPDGDALDVSIRVLSDESEVPETGDGTGRHAPDFKDERGGRGLLVRSERRGREDGRFYIAVITADDGNGGITTTACTLAVCPHDQDQESLDAVLIESSIAADTIDLENLPGALYEHGSAAELGRKQ